MRRIIPIIFAGLVSMTAVSAYANWQCVMHNDRNMVFYGVGDFKKDAAANATYHCAGRGTSAYAANCHLDTCREGNFAPMTGPSSNVGGSGPWYCTVQNKAGGNWTGYGMDRREAAAAAIGQCAGRLKSYRSYNCSITYCGTR